MVDTRSQNYSNKHLPHMVENWWIAIILYYFLVFLLVHLPHPFLKKVSLRLLERTRSANPTAQSLMERRLCRTSA